MHEIVKAIRVGARAGELSGGFLGLSHYALKPLGDTFPFSSPLFNYVYGSASCLTALSGALLVVKPKNPVSIIVMCVEIWGLSGTIVAGTYLLDTVTDKMTVGVLRGRQHTADPLTSPD